MSAPPVGLPAYAGMLAARHAAHAAELAAVARSLPLPAAADVLELCCGDGFLSGRIADRNAGGRAACVDLRPDLLRWAVRREAPRPLRPVAGDAERLPFADAAFDLVWCGQNLMTLRGSADALRECARVLRPGGVLAVLESDRLTELRLPWDPVLDLASPVASGHVPVRERQRADATAALVSAPPPRRVDERAPHRPDVEVRGGVGERGARPLEREIRLVDQPGRPHRELGPLARPEPTGRSAKVGVDRAFGEGLVCL